MSPNLGVASEPNRRSLHPPLLLIQVPSLPARQAFAGPSSMGARRRSSPRRRRRLRREVRVAALALLFCVPIAGLSLTFWPSESRSETPASSLAASLPILPETGRMPEGPTARSLVTISLEPAAGDRLPEFEPPVVRPAGFLLPDLGSEDPAHAGG
jgi:hypothetical protein